MNESTYVLMSKAERWKSPQALKNKHTRLLCKAHGVQTVTEHQLDGNKGTVVLECSCTRPLFSSDAIASYEEAKQNRNGHRTVRGSNQKVQTTEAA